MALTELDTSGRVPVLRVAGDIDLETAGGFRAALAELVGRAKGPVVVDFSGVGFCDSTGLKVLEESRRTARDCGAQLILVCPQERLVRLFRITGLYDSFVIHPTVELALASSAAVRVDNE